MRLAAWSLPGWLRTLLQHALLLLPLGAEAERQWAEHAWNINNMPRAHDSVLR